MVGGMSPDYVAKDRSKDSVGYSDNKKGVTGMLDYTHEFGADFTLAVSKVEENLTNNQKTVWISVKNVGTLIPFNLNKDNDKSVAFTTKYKMLPI